MPAVEEFYRDELKEAGTKVIGITQFRTTEEEALKFVEENELSFPTIYDGRAEVAARYGVDGVPTYVFIDRDGNVAAASSGARGIPALREILNNIGQ